MGLNAALVREREKPIGLRVEPESSVRNTYQAFRILHLGFTVAPVVAGLDKFSNRLVQWEQYLAPVVPRVLRIKGKTFMRVVGVIEVIAGLGVALRPRVFGYMVSAWLGGVLTNLLIQGKYLDIALRDLGLSLGALALSRLCEGLAARRERYPERVPMVA